MPVCRPLGQGLREVRAIFPATALQKIPNQDLVLARRRMKEVEQ